MKSSFKLIAELLTMVESFEETNQKADMQTFLQYASEKNNNEAPAKSSSETNNQIGFYLNYLFRFFKGYTKVALRKSTISTADDFIFLATLSRETSMRKTDLIKINMMELPSGMEVIKRLLKNKLVTELEDPEDKRSVRLQITDIGKKELYIIFGEMNIVGNVLVGKLSAEEIEQLHALLKKLFMQHQSNKEIDYSDGLQVLL
jgi:MarR family transcriptional regulator, lower aerobic nicotinate degradation pathway regulator